MILGFIFEHIFGPNKDRDVAAFMKYRDVKEKKFNVIIN